MMVARLKWANSDEEGGKRHLFVKNLPSTFSDEEVKQIFGEFGELQGVKVGKEPDGTSREHAFVSFVNQEDAQKALDTLHLKVFDEKPLYVAWHMTREQRQMVLFQNQFTPMMDHDEGLDELATLESGAAENGEAAPQLTPQTMYHNPGKSRKGKGKGKGKGKEGKGKGKGKGKDASRDEPRGFFDVRPPAAPTRPPRLSADDEFPELAQKKKPDDEAAGAAENGD
jgi:RNA recognition motif-containing protein